MARKSDTTPKQFIGTVSYYAMIYGKPCILIEGADVICEFRSGTELHKGRLTTPSATRAAIVAEQIREKLNMHETDESDTGSTT